MVSLTSGLSVTAAITALSVLVGTREMMLVEMLVAFDATENRPFELASVLGSVDPTAEVFVDTAAVSVVEANDKDELVLTANVLAIGADARVKLVFSVGMEKGGSDGSTAHADGTTGIANESPLGVADAAAEAEVALGPSVTLPLSSPFESSPSSSGASPSVSPSSLSSVSLVSVAVGRDVSVVIVAPLESVAAMVASVVVELRVEESVTTRGKEVSVPDGGAVSVARVETPTAVAFADASVDRIELVGTTVPTFAAESDAVGKLLLREISEKLVTMALQLRKQPSEYEGGLTYD